jgi:hypothetical protein
MTALKPWLEVAEPRRDIADGSFDESLFAADLGLVDRGRRSSSGAIESGRMMSAFRAAL